VVPTLTTTSETLITQTTASSGGNISSDGGASVTARGVCWSTGDNPTTALTTKTSNGTGTGVFTSSLTGLAASTHYYVRAYATNSIGTGYGTEQGFTTSSGSQTGTVTDIEGNIYNTVTIGTQAWMAENLKTTKYNDGTAIPFAPYQVLITPAYTWFLNDEASFKATYGALYNWYTVSATTNDGKNICPTGWHIPTDSEWTILTTYLGGETLAGGKLKEIGTAHWGLQNIGATNESGFTALPGGYRNPLGGYNYLGGTGNWWSSTENSMENSWCRIMGSGFSYVSRSSVDKRYGISARCVKD
jgi:uncharacterized protein (TIGR02145 family)